MRVYSQDIGIRQSLCEDEAEILLEVLLDIDQPDRDFLAGSGKFLLRVDVRHNVPAVLVKARVATAVHQFAEHPEVGTVVTERAELEPLIVQLEIHQDALAVRVPVGVVPALAPDLVGQGQLHVGAVRAECQQ